MKPRVLIVGTVPYNRQMSSRAFDAYFHFWEKENLAQVFSHTKKPCHGHCGTLYQITDHRLLKRWCLKKIDTGVIYKDSELDDEWQNNSLDLDGVNTEKLYKVGRKHTATTHLLRGLLWRKRLWCTKKFRDWLDEFKPECVFLSFSDDYFIPEIALYVAKRYDIPIVSSIGDDYYFNKHFSLNPAYQLYKETYKALIRKVFRHKGSAIYISDKIRDKYNSEFNLDGETVYLNSEIQRKSFSEINTVAPIITYFGNIRMGRNNSLNEIGYALGRINPDYRLEVYSNEADAEIYEIFNVNPSVKYMGSVPYAQVQKRMAESDISVIVEGFENKDIELSRYSLSTKAADALASGSAILTYGSADCGIVEYMKSTEASMVCDDKSHLEESIRELIQNKELQRQYYDKAIEISHRNHDLESSCAVFEGVVKKAIEKGKENVKK